MEDAWLVDVRSAFRRFDRTKSNDHHWLARLTRSVSLVHSRPDPPSVRVEKRGWMGELLGRVWRELEPKSMGPASHLDCWPLTLENGLDLLARRVLDGRQDE
jgi:hypothetical protein